MSKTKQGSSARLGRESASQRLGIKIHDGQAVKVGMIIVRQRGSKYVAGKNVKVGSDDTIYAMKNGVVKFGIKSKTHFDDSRKASKMVYVVEATAKEPKAKAKTK